MNNTMQNLTQELDARHHAQPYPNRLGGVIPNLFARLHQTVAHVVGALGAPGTIAARRPAMPTLTFWEPLPRSGLIYCAPLASAVLALFLASPSA